MRAHSVRTTPITHQYSTDSSTMPKQKSPLPTIPNHALDKFALNWLKATRSDFLTPAWACTEILLPIVEATTTILKSIDFDAESSHILRVQLKLTEKYSKTLELIPRASFQNASTRIPVFDLAIDFALPSNLDALLKALLPPLCQYLSATGCHVADNSISRAWLLIHDAQPQNKPWYLVALELPSLLPSPCTDTPNLAAPTSETWHILTMGCSSHNAYHAWRLQTLRAQPQSRRNAKTREFFSETAQIHAFLNGLHQWENAVNDEFNSEFNSINKTVLLLKFTFIALLKTQISNHDESTAYNAQHIFTTDLEPHASLPQTIDFVWHALFPSAPPDTLNDLHIPLSPCDSLQRLRAIQKYAKSHANPHLSRLFSLPNTRSTIDEPSPFSPTLDLFDLFDAFSFSLREKTANIDENAITPEILSTIFESSLSKQNSTQNRIPTDGRKTGTYYTPRPVASLMATHAILNALQQRLPKFSAAQILRPHEFASSDRHALQKAIDELQCLDPACGCGAFIMAFLQTLNAIAPTPNIPHAIANAVFATDIQFLPLEITRLRLLALLCTLSAKPTPSDTVPPHFLPTNALHADFEKMPNFPPKFDIVLCNPPYGIEISADLRKLYQKQYPDLCLKNKFDIYMPFFGLGFQLSKAVLCFITPDKWLSNNYAKDFRENCAIPHLTHLIHIGRETFRFARVDAAISLFSKRKTPSFIVSPANSSALFSHDRQILKSTLAAPFTLDHLFLPPSPVLALFEKQSHTLRDYIQCRYAILDIQLAYKIKPFIQSVPNPDPNVFLKLLNTGTIDKYTSRWHKKTFVYLHGKYAFPCIAREDVQKLFPPSLTRALSGAKLIVKGLNRLDATCDLSDAYLPSITTLVVHAQNDDSLKIVAAILNASITRDYMKSKFMSNSWNGAIRFTPAMILDIPVPPLETRSLQSNAMQAIIRAVDALLQTDDPENQAHLQQQLDACVSRLYQSKSEL